MSGEKGPYELTRRTRNAHEWGSRSHVAVKLVRRTRSAGQAERSPLHALL